MTEQAWEKVVNLTAGHPTGYLKLKCSHDDIAVGLDGRLLDFRHDMPLI